MALSREQLLDKISELLVESGWVNSDEYLRSMQYTLGSGRFEQGRDEGQEIVLFDSDTIPNAEDIAHIDELIGILGDVELNQLGIQFGSQDDGNYGSVFLTSPSLNAPIDLAVNYPSVLNNVSQFLTYEKTYLFLDYYYIF